MIPNRDVWKSFAREGTYMQDLEDTCWKASKVVPFFHKLSSEPNASSQADKDGAERSELLENERMRQQVLMFIRNPPVDFPASSCQTMKDLKDREKKTWEEWCVGL